MGKSSAKKAEQLQGEAADRYTKLATDLSAEAAPARQQVGDYYSSIIKGGPAAYKSISPQVDFTKQQFANARRTVANSAPAGGGYMGANRTLAANQAQTVSNLYRDKINEALQGLQRQGEFGTQAGLSANGGVEQAGQGLGQLSAQRLAGWMSGLSGISGAVGTYFGTKAAP